MKKHRPPQGFVDIPGYEGLYAISRSGRVLSFPNRLHIHAYVLRNCVGGNGYKMVGLIDFRKKRKNAYIHRLLAKVYLRNPDPRTYPEVNHINGKKEDNRLCNLEWCTPSHNIRHSYATGLNYISEKRRSVARGRILSVQAASCAARRKPVMQLSNNGCFVNRFNSVVEAGVKLNINTASISAVLKGKRNTAGGFKWAYAEKESNEITSVSSSVNTCSGSSYT
jgi:hypothetical protein